VKDCVECGLPLDADSLRCAHCGAPTGESVLVDGRYVLEGELGRGAMGTVYRARDVALKRTAALKFISPDGARETKFLERFRREATALASVRHHNVVHVFTMGTHAGKPFYAMEYVEGRDLDAIVREHKSHGTMVPVYAALNILRQLALGLDAVHRAGIVHRDVKPGNVVIEDRSGRPVLLDFGLARPVERDAANATVTAGTAPYMAPEQIDPHNDDDELGARTDVYGLGCTAFELLTGRPPFLADNLYAFFQKHLHEEAPWVSRFRPELAPLDPVIHKALQKSPSARYESAAAFAQALEVASLRWREVGTPLPPPYTTPPSEHPPPAADARVLRVLIVDDDPMFRRIAWRAARLATRGRSVEVVEANSGIRALTACVERPPDLVVLDYDMPGPNGIATLSEMRALPGAARAAVLVVSSSVGDIERWRFSVLGVKDFLDKPVVFETFVRAIQRIAELAAQDTNPVPEPVDPLLRPRTLPKEVFLALLAVGWADGRLDDVERDAVFAAAEEARLGTAEIDFLKAAARSRVELDELHVDRLRTAERAYVYAVARWIALVDGELSEREVAMLRVLAFALQMNANTQVTIEAMVAEVLSDLAVARDRRAVLAALRRLVGNRYESDPPHSVA
jgi:serine/threonine-protein kinase